MTERARSRVFAAGLLVTAAAVVAMLLPMVASSETAGVREIRLVARDMTFYVEGQQEPNPTIALRPGEQVRIRIRNEDAGMRHDFAVQAWGVASRMLDDRGQEDSVLLRAPAEPGTTAYVCTPHSRMMSGTVRVE
ncbi:MAG TPA: plastocyanin/azurin family copper-binding protein [Vicinamibacterales bacterium]|nr:plastocyanin/azurin family copper-binding protein [Vicinamibacterales bacterium]